MIRNVKLSDAAQITDIYNHYIMESDATFEVVPLRIEEMQQRITEISDGHPYLVYESEGRVLGYCYAHPWKTREAYRHTMETTVYVAEGHSGKGIGTALMERLIALCRQNGHHALIACITGNNISSINLHRQLGFTQASFFKEVGHKHDQWLDVVDYQLLL